MLVTLRFTDYENLVCESLDNLDYQIDDIGLAIYKNSKLIGHYTQVIGMEEDEFLKYVENHLIEKEIEIK